MAKMTLNQAMQKANEAYTDGKFEAAKRLLARIIQIEPNNAAANHNMGHTLAASGDLAGAIPYFQIALEADFSVSQHWFSFSNALFGVGRYNEAAELLAIARTKGCYGKAFDDLEIKLNSTEIELRRRIEKLQEAILSEKNNHLAFFGIGEAWQKLGKLEEAVEAYNKALAIKPDYASVYNNMGIALADQGKMEEALEVYNKLLTIKPGNAGTYNNMGVAFANQGKLQEAIKFYNKALTIKPDHADAIENLLALAVQLLPIIANYGYDFNNCETQVGSEVMLRPKYQIQNAIKAYLEANFSKAHWHNKNFKACDQKIVGQLDPMDKVFCNSYSNFIERLLGSSWNEEVASKYKAYHLGESHSLSYAHRNITIGGSNFRVVPRITFGAKAFHFCRTKYDQFKAITNAHFISLPQRSKVFLSYGEIDCRPNEGFITAARKFDKPLEKLIDQTVEGYVQWFSEQNAGPKHHLYFINVPAPLYDEKRSSELNSDVARTVSLFNDALKKYCLQHGFYVVDVFKFTVGSEGFSNGLFHVDYNHLGVKAIAEIEKQLT